MRQGPSQHLYEQKLSGQCPRAGFFILHVKDKDEALRQEGACLREQSQRHPLSSTAGCPAAAQTVQTMPRTGTALLPHQLHSPLRRVPRTVTGTAELKKQISEKRG